MTTIKASARHSHSSAVTPTPAPAPAFIFRGHDAPIHAIEFFASNTFLATGDETGWICIWDIWRRRQVHKWRGHPSSSVLALKAVPFTIASDSATAPAEASPSAESSRPSRHARSTALQEWAYIISHGRDNEIHVWDINDILHKSLGRSSASVAGTMAAGNNQNQVPVFSLPVNALNFCKMAVLPTDTAPQARQDPALAPQTGSAALSRTHQHIYIAVPSPTTPALVDIYDIVKPERTFASVGNQTEVGSAPTSPGTDEKLGSVMAIQLFQRQVESLANPPSSLQMLVAYEGGSVVLLQESSTAASLQLPIGGSKKKRRMDILWAIKCHREPVSCGSDNILVRYHLSGQVQGVPEVTRIPLKTNGIADIKIRDDGKIIALAGWDG
ncbi:ASTRA complex subunit, partial [Dissophora globulifera]